LPLQHEPNTRDPSILHQQWDVFDKLQGTKNYIAWKNRIRTVLISLRQWGVVSGSIVAPTPTGGQNKNIEEVKAQEAWEVCEMSAFMYAWQTSP
jgi:hypothetical protein